MYRCRPPYKGTPSYANFQYASRSTNILITSLLQAMTNLMTDQAGGMLRFGMAPPSATERALHQLVDQLGGDDDE